MTSTTLTTIDLRDRLQTAKRKATQWAKRDFAPSWRYVFNAQPSLQHRRTPPELAPEAVRVVHDLRAHGVAKTTLAALVPQSDLLLRLQERAHGLMEEQRDDIQRRRDGLAAGDPDLPRKPFLIELMGARPAVDPADPFATFARHEQVLGVAETYCGMQLKIRDLNAWLNLADPSGPTSSQLWHRDLPEDHYIVKVFVNLFEVGDENGPLHYLNGSHLDRRLARGAGVSDDGLAARLDPELLESLAAGNGVTDSRGPAGTVTFADTRGIHRGGHAVGGDRLLLHALYASRSSVRHPVLRAADGVSAQALQGFSLR